MMRIMMRTGTQVQEEDDECELMRSTHTSWVMVTVLDGFLVGNGSKGKKRKRR